MLSAALLAGCVVQPVAPTTPGKSNSRAGGSASAGAAKPGTGLIAAGAGLSAAPGAGAKDLGADLVGTNGGVILSNNGGSALPDDASGIFASNSGGPGDGTKLPGSGTKLPGGGTKLPGGGIKGPGGGLIGPGGGPVSADQVGLVGRVLLPPGLAPAGGDGAVGGPEGAAESGVGGAPSAGTGYALAQAAPDGSGGEPVSEGDPGAQGAPGNEGEPAVVNASPEQVPFADATVRVLDAKGQPVLGTDGLPLAARTDGGGGYAIQATLPARTLLLEVTLPADRGALRAIVPQDGAALHYIDLDCASSLATGYLLSQFVRPQADPLATLERLRPDVEELTRMRVSEAWAAAGTTPERLGDAEIVAAVQALRQHDPDLNAQLVALEQLLQGVGGAPGQI